MSPSFLTVREFTVRDGKDLYSPSYCDLGISRKYTAVTECDMYFTVTFYFIITDATNGWATALRYQTSAPKKARTPLPVIMNTAMLQHVKIGKLEPHTISSISSYRVTATRSRSILLSKTHERNYVYGRKSRHAASLSPFVCLKPQYLVIVTWLRFNRTEYYTTLDEITKQGNMRLERRVLNPSAMLRQIDGHSTVITHLANFPSTSVFS